ncbi:MAG: 2Fe-2S iron-sulfur cluster binding domain-containing protein [Deltaproteobacteria bacterium]|nr:2Fe-2S iron-sulfur cluster binding domain-containing protein [Deltaproteobacteria bacterium]MBI3078121.1 2Fe-2S iron-sulfur cluster binding domain-containing protein [Deltaproteobacteria bacterium]
MSRTARPITVTVRRFDPGHDTQPRYERFEVPSSHGLSVLQVMAQIYEQSSPSLAFMYSCRLGKCTSCHVRVNGKVRLACSTIVDGDLVLEPVPHYAVIRDLAVDWSRPLVSRREKGGA